MLPVTALLLDFIWSRFTSARRVLTSCHRESSMPSPYPAGSKRLEQKKPAQDAGREVLRKSGIDAISGARI
jgi:hypothetical protein